MIGQGLLQLLQRLHRPAERATGHDSLAVRRHLLQLEAPCPVHLSQHPLPHHPQTLADLTRLCPFEIQSRNDSQTRQPSSQILAHPPQRLAAYLGHKRFSRFPLAHLKHSPCPLPILLGVPIGQLGQHLGLPDPYAHGDPCPPKHLHPQLPGFLHPKPIAQFQKRLINRIDLHHAHLLPQNRHHPCRHVPIQRVVGTKHPHPVLPDHLLLLMQRRPHRNPQGFGLLTS